ncbi:hypothetical protein C8N36_10363 [Pelagimonas varians]|uniref:Uncharacterized protein n=1 Tax=Pelagimonas varians TaxID=696760 RepID=A0A238KII3_9RHOB|nr:hypothetical protein C8N36_10363 [Pelagimonas varians]SMX41872.1 hypothetical protein PEV8663_02367 [Pelagimonas varians]
MVDLIAVSDANQMVLSCILDKSRMALFPSRGSTLRIYEPDWSMWRWANVISGALLA